jgi:hypothetical protein
MRIVIMRNVVVPQKSLKWDKVNWGLNLNNLFAVFSLLNLKYDYNLIKIYIPDLLNHFFKLSCTQTLRH